MMRNTILKIAMLAAFCLLAGALSAEVRNIVFMTDFGDEDDSVAICKGVILSIAKESRIIDVTHRVKPYSILDAARYLSGVTPYYPPGTVFLVVVDPGVGSNRKPIVARSRKGHYFVLPDNGLLTLVDERDGLDQIREIQNSKWMIGTGLSSTFHGRDIFAPVAARLARKDDWKSIGPLLNNIARISIHNAAVNEGGITGEVVGLDGPFGNLITNIKADLFGQLGYRIGEEVSIRLANRDVKLPYATTFSDVAVGHPLLYIGSRGTLCLAVNQSSFAKVFEIEPPVKIFVARKK